MLERQKYLAFALVLIPLVYLAILLNEKHSEGGNQSVDQAGFGPNNLLLIHEEDALVAAQADSSYDAWLQLGMVYIDHFLPEKAIWALETAVAMNPKSAYGFCNLCEQYNNIGDYDKAITACSKALKLRPGYKIASYQLEVANHRKAGEEDWK